MTDFGKPARTDRRLWPDPPRVFNALPSQSSAARPEAMPAHLRRPAPPATGNGGGQSPVELIAHLVIALSRHLRQLRADGGRVPAQLEDLIIVLADRVRGDAEVPMLDHRRAGSDSSAIPRLLITKSDAAKQLDVSLRTIERLISAGRLPLVHVEGAARVRVADLEAYVQGLEVDGRPHAPPADRASLDN